MVVFATLGFMQLTWLSRLADIKSVLNLTPGQLAFLLLALAVGSLTGLPMGDRFIHRFGAKHTVWLAAAIALPALVLSSVSVTLDWPLWLTMLGLAPFGFGIGIWDVAMNYEAAVIEHASGRAIMPWFHAAYSAGAVATATLTAILIQTKIPLLAQSLAAVAICAIAVIWGTGKYGPSTASDTQASKQQAKPAKSPWREPRTLLIGVVTLCAAFIEGVANDWTAIGFLDGHKTSTFVSVLALSAFLTFWTAGRIFGTRALDRFGRLPALRVSFLLVITGTLVTVFAPTPIAFLGVALWGLGASLGFPVGISAAADDPDRAAARISVVATIGYGAFIAGPALVGFLGDIFGVLKAILVVAVLAFLALLLTPVTKKQELD